jgi:single-strand DNA-binding protein
VKKSSQLLIEGKIQTRRWDDRESGQKKYRTEILIHDLTLLGGRPEDEGRGSSGRSHARTGSVGFGHAHPVNGEDYSDQGITADEIPF